MLIDPQIQNKVALITGGNHGIGEQLAKSFAAHGVKVFITYYPIPLDENINPDDTHTPGEAQYAIGRSKDAQHVIDFIHRSGGQVEAYPADLGDPAVIPLLFDKAEAAFGPVEILINNAAHWQPGTFIPSAENTLNAENHDRHFNVNTRATALMMVEFAKRHTARNANWGRIINISTDAAYAFPTEAAYGTSKYAIEAYSRTAALELGQFGITVNTISPGPIQTGYITPEFEKELTPNIPLGRLGYPDDIADVAVFLASHQARWVTGQLIQVGGGHRV